MNARAGDTEQAVSLLDDALARFEALRVEIDAALVKALLAEAALFDGRPDDALERVGALFDAVPEEALMEPLLQLLTGVAQAQLGTPESGEHARERDELVAKLDIERLALPPLVRPRAAAAPAG